MLRGKDRKRELQIREIEAEAVACIFWQRNGVDCRSPKYLYTFIRQEETFGDLDHYAITTAAGHIERLLDLSRSMKRRD